MGESEPEMIDGLDTIFFMQFHITEFGSCGHGQNTPPPEKLAPQYSPPDKKCCLRCYCGLLQ